MSNSEPTNLAEAIRSPFQHLMWIDGQYRESGDGEQFDREYPAGKGVISVSPSASRDDVERAIKAAARSFRSGVWSDCYGGQRARVLSGVADCIRNDIKALALIETLETGKPLQASRDEVMASAELWDYAAGLARTVHGDSQSNLGGHMLGIILQEPVGVAAIITPWNFPLLIASERIPFALAAGCSLIVKPSEYTSGTTLRLARYLEKSGLPAGVCNFVSGPGNKLGPLILESEMVRMISFTGSPRVGRTVMEAAAKDAKKVSLELGGKSPSIVFDDCEFDAAIDGVLKAANFNAGQCCIAGTRLILEDTIADAFIDRLQRRIKKINVGDPFDSETTIGSIVNYQQLAQIENYVDCAIRDGARLVCGGSAASDDGYFYPPTIIDSADPQSSIAQNEVFGPVLCVFRFQTVKEAIQLANSTEYGLASYIWTKDISKALHCAKKVAAGRIWINSALNGFPEMPLGGFKRSGIGRETGRLGILEYCETKSLHVFHADQTERWVEGRRD